MQQIDFLPVEYKQKHARRQSQPWQVAAATAVILMVAVATLAQRYSRRAVESDLAAIAPVYDAAVEQQNRLAEVQKRLLTARSSAELYTYLKHPWPRTQLLHALVTPLPESITLQEIHISRELSDAPPTQPVKKPPVDAAAEAERLKSLTPAELDLAELSAKLDNMQTVVTLSGTATDIAALHKYIGDLDETNIFDEAKLDCFNSVERNKHDSTIQFRAVLNVLPGYGQLGGPTGPAEQQLVGTK